MMEFEIKVSYEGAEESQLRHALRLYRETWSDGYPQIRRLSDAALIAHMLREEMEKAAPSNILMRYKLIAESYEKEQRKRDKG